MPHMRFIGGKHHGRSYNVNAHEHVWRVVDAYECEIAPYSENAYADCRNVSVIYSTYIRRNICYENGSTEIIMAAEEIASDGDEIIRLATGGDQMPEQEAEPIKLRWYQEDSVDSLMTYFDDNDGHPVVAVPTGAGKTIILCEFINQFLSDYPGSKVLVLSHVKEILEQDYNALTKYFDGYEVGLWSAGLGSKTKKNITVAGIQSVYKSPEVFNDVNIVIIDEAHLINTKDEGMYRSFLGALDKANYVGLTATHFRLGHGYIHEGEEALFTDLVYDLTSRDNFNRLVDEGYLSKMISKATDANWDTSDVRTRAGDFRIDDLSTMFDRNKVTDEAVAEIIKYGKNYSAWLIFAIDINHAEHIAERLNKSGIKTACVHSKMKDGRDEYIEGFRNGQYRCMVNVDILTTGFDVPHIDLIAMLRPTKSPVLHVQSIGRGLRVVYKEGMPIDTMDERLAAIDASRKTHCLVLDFAGNTERLGPINDVTVKTKGKGSGTGDPVVKKCPECDVYHHPSVKECDVCGHIFQFKHNLQSKASDKAPVLSELEPQWLDVNSVNYFIHQKKGKPSSLRVEYRCGLMTIKEWICIDHPPGYAKHKADAWVRWRVADTGVTTPKNLQELYAIKTKLKTPTKIHVKKDGMFYKIVDSHF